MELSTVVMAFALIAAFWFWWRTMQAQEIAERLARVACERERVQFLDGTVSLKRIQYRKDKRGNYHLLRYFNFDFSVSGSDRYSGVVAMHGAVQHYLQMDLPEQPTITVEPEIEAEDANGDGPNYRKLH